MGRLKVRTVLLVAVLSVVVAWDEVDDFRCATNLYGVSQRVLLAGATRAAFPSLPIPLGDRRSSIWGDPVARIYPEMPPDRPENGFGALREGGGPSLRDMVGTALGGPRRGAPEVSDG